MHKPDPITEGEVRGSITSGVGKELTTDCIQSADVIDNDCTLCVMYLMDKALGRERKVQELRERIKKDQSKTIPSNKLTQTFLRASIETYKTNSIDGLHDALDKGYPVLYVKRPLGDASNREGHSVYIANYYMENGKIRYTILDSHPDYYGTSYSMDQRRLLGERRLNDFFVAWRYFKPRSSAIRKP